MPTITINKDVLEHALGKKLPLEELQDRISMLGTALEKIEGNQIEVEIFPNRPDLLSEQGFARAFSSFLGIKTGLKIYEVQKSNQKVIVDKNVTMRPYTACAMVKNLKFNDERIKEIMQVQEKLATTHGRNRKKSAYGIYPLDHITFPIKYTALDPAKVKFQPLGFPKEILASQVLELHPKGQAYAHLTKEWKTYPFFVDAKQKIMCMLPFTNSEETGKVTLQTKEVFIECSGTDLNNVMIALNILVTTLADMGGSIYSLEIEYSDKKIITPNLAPHPLAFDLAYINQRLGLQLSEKEASMLLQRMGYGYENHHALVPAYRADILHQIDLAEDIAIAYGYENFKEELPQAATIGQEHPSEKFYHTVRELLIGLGLQEVKNVHLTLNLQEKMQSPEPIIPLKNSVGDNNHLRNSLLPSLLQNLAENQHHEYPQNIFEIGRIFTAGKTETGIQEREKLAVVLCHEKADFTQIRQVLEALLQNLGLSKITINETEHPSFIQGRVGKILLEHQEPGIVGEIHPQVLTNFGLIMPTVGFEMEVGRIVPR